MLCYLTLSDSNCLKICEKAVGMCILADLHLRFAGGNYQHLQQCHVVRHISVRNHQKTKGTEAKAINWNTVYISILCGWFTFTHRFNVSISIFSPWTSKSRRLGPLTPGGSIHCTCWQTQHPRPQGPKAPRPQDPAWPSVAAVLAAFSKNHSGAPGPSGAVLTGEVKVLLDQRGSSSNGWKPWKQHQPASF